MYIYKVHFHEKKKKLVVVIGIYALLKNVSLGHVKLISSLANALIQKNLVHLFILFYF